MLQITQTKENGYDVYSFENRGTDYQVLSNDGVFFQVWSKRKSLSNLSAPKVYTLKEMAQRSKALKHLAQLIAA